MTTDRDYYGEFNQSTIIRNARNGMPYAIQNEQRYVPSNVDRPRTGSRGYQETNGHDGDDSKQNQRRRINIACGRCRKRKIRCSGAQGDSGCQNCKTAGNDNCQFNRVASSPLALVGTDLSFGALGTMANHLPLSSVGRTQYVDVGMPPSSWMMPMGSNGRLSFRQSSLEYLKPGAYGGHCGDYPEEIGYSSMAYPPPMHQESFDSGYYLPPPPPAPRSFTAGPPLVHKHSNLSCYEPSGSYPQPTQHAQSHHQLPQYAVLPGQSFALPLRSNALHE